MTFEEAKQLAEAGHLLGAREMRALFRIGVTKYKRLLREGAFEPFRVKHAVDPQRCFSGILVTRHRGNEPLYEPFYGRKRA